MNKKLSIYTLSLATGALALAMGAHGAPEAKNQAPGQPVSGASSTAGGNQAAEAGAGAVNVNTVSTLNSNLDLYKNKMVTVHGEIDDKINDRAFLLESGGLINDELVVVASDKLDPSQLQAIKEDSEVQVKGTVKVMSLNDAKKEFRWTLSKDEEKELKDVKTFLVAVSIGPGVSNP